jgi:hypothetical protein
MVATLLDWERFGKDVLLGEVTVPFEDMAAAVHNTGGRLNIPLPNTSAEISFHFDINPLPFVETVSPVAAGATMAAKPASAAPSPSQTVWLEPFHLPSKLTGNNVTMVIDVADPTRLDNPVSATEPAVFFTGKPLVAYCHILVGLAQIQVRGLWMSFGGSFKGSTTWLSSKEKMIQDKRNILRNDPRSPVTLKRGRHVFPFQVFLPYPLPSSLTFKDDVKVRYHLKIEADVVDMPDLCASLPIRVINPEDTQFGIQVTSAEPKVLSIRKSPMNAGGPIEVRLAVPQAGVAPGQEIELDMVVDNQSAQKIKKVEVSLVRLTSCNGNRPEKDTIFETKKKFFPSVMPKSTVQQHFVIELPKTLDAPHSFARNRFEIAHNLVVTLDIPNARDMDLIVPIRLLARLPKFAQPPADLLASGLDQPVMKWSRRMLHTWTLDKLHCPTAALLLLEAGVCPVELTSVEKDQLRSLLDDLRPTPLCPNGVPAEEKEHFVANISELADKYYFPRRFLRSLGMEYYADKFEAEEIYKEQFLKLASVPTDTVMQRVDRFVKFGMTTGSAMRLVDALSQHLANVQP